MKGCLKFSPLPSPVDTQVQHPNERGNGTGCSHTPATASSSSTTNAASIIPTQAHTETHRKCVAFCAAGSETVYTADEWDRTPSEPARNLSYQELLELKEIQRSLPHANQPPDIITSRPGKQFLSTVPIVLLPLLGPGASPNGKDSGHGAQGSEAKKPCYFSDTHGPTNGSGTGWGPPSLKRQPQTAPARTSFPFPPRPVPFSTPVAKSTFTSLPTSTHTNFQSQKSTCASPPSSPTSPYPLSYSNRPSTTSTSAALPYSRFHQQPPRTQAQTQPRTAWTTPPSLNHLMPSLPIKPRERPKFEFITLLDSGTKTNDNSGPPAAMPGKGDDAGVTTTKVGHPEVPVDSISKPPFGSIERDHHDDEHDLEEHDQDHDVISVTSSSSCPSLCTSCPSSCSASEVDTDHEHESEIEIEGRYFSPNGYSCLGLDRYAKDSYAKDSYAKDWANGTGLGKPFRPTRTTTSSPLSLPSSSPFDLGIGLLLDDDMESHKTMKKRPELKKKRERKFILVNDMEIELDDSGPESESEVEDPVALSGRTTSTSTSTTRETTTTITTTTTEKTTTTTTTTTTTSNGRPSSPRNLESPVPVKLALWGLQPPSSSSSASLITPPTSPPSGQVSQSGHNSSPSSPSIASRGRIKAIQKIGQVVGKSTSRERSGSVGSDTSSGGGGGTSPSRNVRTRIGSPVKLKSKVS